MKQSFQDALAAATEIADKLTDPVTSQAGTGRRRPQSLAGGAAGIALLHIERARSGHGDWATARAWLTVAAREELSTGPNATLYYGAPALAFVTHTAAEEPGKQIRALGRLDDATITITRQRLDHAHRRIDRGDRPLLAEFDLIRGLAGLGAYHLRRHPDHDVTRAVLAYLARLTEPPRDGVPGWWSDVSPNGGPSSEFPGGHGNAGMSHGIAAPLALLSLAVLRGVVVAGQVDAIERICAWLDGWEHRDRLGPCWPGFITLDHHRKGNFAWENMQRPSWCYGTPGIARAQQLAAMATGDAKRQRKAETAMLGCLRDPGERDPLTEPGLCHGTAGLLQAAWRVARDALTSDVADELPALTTRLLEQLRSAPEQVEFLEGLAGIALALQAVGTDRTTTSWDTCLMLA